MSDDDTLRIDFETGEYSVSDTTALLQVIRGEDIGGEFEVKPGNNIIGRQNDCGIRILNKSISRRHAQIICNPEDPPEQRYILYDLHSTNGTRVNNQPVERCALHAGDRVQFGAVVCKFMEIDSLEKNYLKELKKLIEYDKQTDLLQLKPFYQRLEKALADAGSSKGPVSVLMMDLDGLKQINDRHGHLVGTHVIVKIARLIKEELAPAGVVAVYGGDEFIGYLPRVGKDQALERGEHLRRRVSELRFSEKGIQGQVSISIGVAEYPTDSTEMMSLVGDADKALYAAKRTGKNSVVAYDRSMSESRE